MADIIQRYGWNWDAATPDLEIELQAIRWGGEWRVKGGQWCGRGLFYHYRRAMELIWPEDDNHRWSDLVLKTILWETITVIQGGKDCVSGGTRILDPVTGIQPTIAELYETRTAPMVMTAIGPMRASVPFIKGRAPMIRVHCSNGSIITGSGRHFVLSASGAYISLQEVCKGQRLLAYSAIPLASTLGISRSTHVSSDRHLCGISPNWMDRYFRGPDLYGGRLQREARRGVFSAPSLTCAPTHSPSNLHADDLVYGLTHTPYQSQFFRPSIGDCFSPCSSKAYAQSPRALTEPEYGVRSYAPSPRFSEWPREGSLQASELRGDAQHKQNGVTVFPWRNIKVGEIVVQAIESLPPEYFFDLTVPIAHHYFAEGLIHHNSSKTRTASKYALVDYWAFPEETLILLTSTDLRGADYRIWGDVKSLFIRGRDRYDWLPGKALEAKHSICTDDLDETDVRDPRKGITFLPMFGSGGQWIGLAKGSGMKQKRRRLVGDECQFNLAQYVDVLSNLNSGDFKGIFIGNPIGENDPLDRLAEPVAGWGTEGEVTKTTTWRNKFSGVTITLYGPDSPNFDFPQTNGAKKFPYMIGQRDIDWIANTYGKDSSKYSMQALGVRRAGISAKRVITTQLCDQHGATEPAIWSGGATVWVAALDAAYGGIGGDRCILQFVEFGPTLVTGNQPPPGVFDWGLSGPMTKTILKCYPPILVPVSVSNATDPEEQIAVFCKHQCETRGVQPSHFFFDGRGTLAMALARIWSPECNAVEFGGAPTKRPVSQDHWVYDAELHCRRLKRCEEEYSKFVTELWFSVRYAIISGQMRELPRETMMEGCRREWRTVTRDRMEVETKSEMKERTNQSPDLFDALVTAIEGARRLGFQISKMGNATAAASSNQWIEDLARKTRELHRSKELVPT